MIYMIHLYWAIRSAALTIALPKILPPYSSSFFSARNLSEESMINSNQIG